MIKPTTSTAFGFLSALLIATAPFAAHAGTVSIYNKDCRTVVFKPWPVARSRVTVKIDGGSGCTDTKVTIGKGETQTVQLVTRDSNGSTCSYTYAPMGTSDAIHHIFGNENSSVTCKEEGLAEVCDCKRS